MEIEGVKKSYLFPRDSCLGCAEGLKKKKKKKKIAACNCPCILSIWPFLLNVFPFLHPLLFSLLFKKRIVRVLLDISSKPGSCQVAQDGIDILPPWHPKGCNYKCG
jgi:hypothetical protein